MTDHAQSIRAQFDPQAAAYLASAVHSQGPDLACARALLEQIGHCSAALDIGCGAGHLSFLLAGRCDSVMAVDPSPAMLQTVAAEAARRGISGIRTTCAGAEQLPFAARCFDVVATRFSAHHWPDVPRALLELRRVLKPGGRLLVLDLLGEDAPLLDTHLQALELLRDPSHVRDYTSAEWQAMLRAAGFAVERFESWPLRLEFAAWVQRMRTPAPAIEAIRALLRAAPAEVRLGLRIENDGSFSARSGLFLAG